LDLLERKRQLRRTLRRRETSEQAVARAGSAAARHLADSRELKQARRVVLYAALPGELPSRPLFDVACQTGLPVLFPRITGSDLEFARIRRWEELVPGRYGVLEPPRAQAGGTLTPGDLVLVPGLAFDERGNRLGRGKGYYDRALAGASGLDRVGAALAFQVLSELPSGPQDEAVEALLTEEGLRRFRRNA